MPVIETPQPPRSPGHSTRRTKRILLSAAAVVGALAGRSHGQIQPLTGTFDAHDPSTITKEASTYFYFSTGTDILSHTSTNLTNWKSGKAVFTTVPSWIPTAVPGFVNTFWAPDVIFQNNQYYLYYAASTFGSQVSAIGLATNPTLNPSDPNYLWTDQGAIIQSNSSVAYNTIDPSLVQNSDGTLWMSFGSFFGGIYLAQLNPANGKLLNPVSTSPPTRIASNNSNNSNNYFKGIEASYIVQHDGFYYLFDNWGACCAGVASTYNIRVGRSTSVTGPYLDQNGVNVANGSSSNPGGTLFLGNDGNQIGPGQISVFTNGTQQEIGYHYYDGNNNGAPEEGIRDLFWTANDWPTIAPVNPVWTGTDGNWSTVANWSNGGVNTVPNAAGNIANFNTLASGQRTITLDGGAKTVATINFNSTSGFTIGSAAGNGLIFETGNTDNATINVQLGSHNILAPITAMETLGVNITPSASTLTLGAVSGVGLTQYGSGTLALTGTNSYTSNIFVHQGTLDITGAVTAGSFNSIGDVAGDTGTMNVRLSGSFTSAGDLNIGDTGNSGTAATGTLNLSGSGQITINSGGGFYVGSGFSKNTTANGTVFQSGGTLTANGSADDQFTIGGRTSSLAIGIYNLSAGNVNANTNVWDGGFGTGTVNQTGGTFTAAANVAIGRQSGSIGIWNISAGALNQTASTSNLSVGQTGTGTLNLSGTGQVTTASALFIGQNTGSTGTINLNGGALITTAVQKGSGTANLNFNGGTLKPGVSNTSFLPLGIAATVKNGGAKIDTNNFNITIAAALLHDPNNGSSPDGGLNKNGLGTLTLSGTNTYTGPTTINAGALTLASSGSISSSPTVTVATGAMLNAAGATNDGLATNTALNVSGTATFAAGALNGGLTPRTLSSVTINTGGAVQLASPPAHTDRQVLITSALTFGGGNHTWQGLLDLTGNDLIATGGSLSNITDQLKQGFNAGAGYWNGSGGIVSSTAASDTRFLTTLGSIAGGVANFDGITNTTSADVLVKYTYYGDADLSGTVDGADYHQIDLGFGAHLTGWSNGDFNYDGVVNGSDYALIDNTFNQINATSAASLAIIATPTSAIAQVPEPATLALLSLGTFAALRSRRRRSP